MPLLAVVSVRTTREIAFKNRKQCPPLATPALLGVEVAVSGWRPVFPTPSSGTPSVTMGNESGAVQLGYACWAEKQPVTVSLLRMSGIREQVRVSPTARTLRLPPRPDSRHSAELSRSDRTLTFSDGGCADAAMSCRHCSKMAFLGNNLARVILREP